MPCSQPLLPPDLPGIPPLVLTALLGCSAHLRLGFVGGAVRDLLLHRLHRDPLTGLPDLDLVVQHLDPAAEEEGPAAHRLARSLVEADPSAVGFCRFHEAYGTVELELHGVLLDLATARSERYPRPAENPVVRFGSLEDDLARRDFSINAMALLLQPGEAATLLDPHGGEADLAARQLRLLHERSLTDDPTRLLRAARYVARLDLSLEPASLEQARSTLAAWPWAWSHGDPPGQSPPALGTRLRMELELLLEREDWFRALSALQAWGALTLLDAQLQNDRRWHWRLQQSARFGLPPLAALLAGAADPVALAERLQLPQRQHRLLAGFLGLRKRLEDLGPEAAAWTPARWSALLEEPGGTPEMVALALAAGAGPRRPLLRWWLRWRHLDAGTSAASLMAAEGLKPGPQLGERLRALRRERLIGERL